MQSKGLGETAINNFANGNKTVTVKKVMEFIGLKTKGKANKYTL